MFSAYAHCGPFTKRTRVANVCAFLTLFEINCRLNVSRTLGKSSRLFCVGKAGIDGFLRKLCASSVTTTSSTVDGRRFARAVFAGFVYVKVLGWPGLTGWPGTAG